MFSWLLERATRDNSLLQRSWVDAVPKDFFVPGFFFLSLWPISIACGSHRWSVALASVQMEDLRLQVESKIRDGEYIPFYRDCHAPPPKLTLEGSLHEEHVLAGQESFQ